MKIELFLHKEDLPFLKDQSVDFKETGKGAVANLIKIEIDIPCTGIMLAMLALKMYSAGVQKGLKVAFKSRDNYEPTEY